MNNQYGAQRFRKLPDGRCVGTIPVGSIIYIQDRLGRFDSPVCRNPWIVEAWHNREYTAHHRNAAGQWESVMMVGGHTATVRSLRDGRRIRVADHHLLNASDAGLERFGAKINRPARLTKPHRIQAAHNMAA